MRVTKSISSRSRAEVAGLQAGGLARSPVRPRKQADERQKRFGWYPALVWIAQVAVAMSVAIWLGLTVLPQLNSAREMASYRVVVHELGDAVRTLRPRALAQRRVARLHVDRARRVFQLTSVQQGSPRYEQIDETIWLPAGLEITEAPDLVAATPRGELSAASITIIAPAYNTAFRITVSQGGAVRIAEESML